MALPRALRPHVPAAAAAATAILVGAAIVATRVVVGQTHPASLALLRYLIGVVCLLPPALRSGRPRFARADVLPIALLGIGQFGVLVALLNYALEFIPSARAALIFATLPLIAMGLAAALGRERLSGVKLLGAGLAVGGVGLVLSEKAGVGALAGHGRVGDLAALGSALAGAVCSVLYRPYLRKYPTVVVGAYAMLASVVFLAALAGREGLFNAPPRFTAQGWLAVVFIGAASGLGYYLWLWALAHAPATGVTVFLSLSPLTAAWLGTVLLGEAVPARMAPGIACVAAGLYLTQGPHVKATGRPSLPRSVSTGDR